MVIWNGVGARNGEECGQAGGLGGAWAGGSLGRQRRALIGPKWSQVGGTGALPLGGVIKKVAKLPQATCRYNDQGSRGVRGVDAHGITQTPPAPPAALITAVCVSPLTAHLALSATGAWHKAGCGAEEAQRE